MSFSASNSKGLISNGNFVSLETSSSCSSSLSDEPCPSIVGVGQSPPKPLRKDQVYIFELVFENRGLGISLSIGYRDSNDWKSTIQGNGLVYNRKSSGDFFQIEEIDTQKDFGLKCGDEVLAINDVMLDKYSLEEVALLLEEAAMLDRVRLAITRPKRISSQSKGGQGDIDHDFYDEATSETKTEPMKLSYSEPYQIEMVKDGNKNLGIGIVGGLDAPRGPIGFFIKSIYADGLAAADGRLKKGDEILSLNGIPLDRLTHEQAVNMFRLHPVGPARLTIRSLVASCCSTDTTSSRSSTNQRHHHRPYDDDDNSDGNEAVTSTPVVGNFFSNKILSKQNKDLATWSERSLDGSAMIKSSNEGPSPSDFSQKRYMPEDPVSAEFGSFALDGNASLMLPIGDRVESDLLSDAVNTLQKKDATSQPNIFNSNERMMKNNDRISDYDFLQELNDLPFLGMDISNTVSVGIGELRDNCLKTRPQSHSFEINETCIEPPDEFMCSHSIYIDDSESDDEQSMMDSQRHPEDIQHSASVAYAWNDADGDCELFPSAHVTTVPEGFEDDDVNDNSPRQFIESFSNRPSSWADEQLVQLDSRSPKSERHFDTSEFQVDFKSQSNSVANEQNSSSLDLKFDDRLTHADDSNDNDNYDENIKKMFSKKFVTDAKFEPPFENCDELLEPPPPLPSCAPPPLPSCAPPHLHNLHQQTSMDSATEVVSEDSYASNRDHGVSTSFYHPVLETHDQIFGQLESFNAELSTIQGVSWTKVSNTENADQPPHHNSSIRESSTGIHPIQKHTIHEGLPDAIQGLHLEETNTLLSKFNSPEMTSSQQIKDLTTDFNSGVFETDSLSDNANRQMQFVQDSSWNQIRFQTNCGTNPGESAPASLRFSEMLLEPSSSGISNNDSFHLRHEQIFTDEENEAIARNENEPFQVKWNKSRKDHLGFAVEVTAEGVVICSIDENNSIDQNRELRINDELLAVNGISLVNQTAAEIQQILDNLPLGITRLTVCARPPPLPPLPPPPSNITTEFPSSDKSELTELETTRNPSTEFKSDEINQTAGEFRRLREPKDEENFRKYTPPTKAYSMSKRSLSTDETVGSVLKDYYTVEEVSQKDASSNKPNKPIIAQALLPKSKRSGSLTTGPSEPVQFARIRNGSLSTLDPVSPSFDQLQPILDDSDPLSSTTKDAEGGIININKNNSDGMPGRNDLSDPVMNKMSKQSIESLNFKQMIYSECLDDKKELKPLNSQLHYNAISHRIKGDSFKEPCFDRNDDSVNKTSLSVERSSVDGSILHQFSENSSESGTSNEIERECTRNVASSKAFFESMNDSSSKTPVTNVSRFINSRIGETHQPDDNRKEEEISLTKFDDRKCKIPNLESETNNATIESSNATKPLRSAYIPKAMFESISLLGSDSREMQVGKNKEPLTNRQKSSESKTPNETISTLENKILECKPTCINISAKSEEPGSLRAAEKVMSERRVEGITETDEFTHSDRINVTESKAFFRQIESSTKYDRTNAPTQGKKTPAKAITSASMELTPTKQSKFRKQVGLPSDNESRKGIEVDTFIKEDMSFNCRKNENTIPDNLLNQPHFQQQPGTSNVEMVNVIEAKAYFESLKSSKSSSSSAQKDLTTQTSNAAVKKSATEVASQSEFSKSSSTQSIRPETENAQSQLQSAFTKAQIKKACLPTVGGRHASLPSQKYLPVSGKTLSKSVTLSADSVESSKQLLKTISTANEQSMPTNTPGKTSAFPEALQIDSASETQTVESLVSKYKNLSASPTVNYGNESRQDPSVMTRHKPADHRQHSEVDDLSAGVKDSGGDNTSKQPSPMKKTLLHPLSPTAANSGVARSIVEPPLVAKSQKWKQFMVDYSTMK